MRLLVFPLLAVLLAPTPVFAAESGWTELAPGVAIRLISAGKPDAMGHLTVGLDLRMPANVKTYWRVPGETGIPTTVDFTGSSGIGPPHMIWPYPSIDTSSGYVDFSYFGPVVLPIKVKLTGTGPARVTASVVMGICSDICVPASADLVLDIDPSDDDPGNGLRLSQAVAMAPLPTPIGANWVSSVNYEAAKARLVVKLDPSALDPMTVIADSAGAEVLFGPPQKSPHEGIIYLPLLGSTGRQLVGQPVTLTFLSADGPYEATLRIGSTD
jgi:DsbC/DsbD-like thiol-disulfide interchange protein